MYIIYRIIGLIILQFLFLKIVMANEYFFTGDTIVTNNLSTNLFNPVKKYIKENDLISMNFEGTIDTKKYFIPKCFGSIQCFVFSSEVDSLKNFHKNTIFNLANNHSMDYGFLGQEKTIKILSENNFNYFGTNKHPFYIHEKTVFIGASPHMGTLSIFGDDLINLVKYFKNKGFIVIVNLHMGAEGVDKYLVKNEDEFFLGQNRGNIYSLSRKLIDSGADIIVGHGPHIIRGIEKYKNKIILYSLGNFLTYGNFDLRNELSFSIMVKIKINQKGDFESGKIFGFQQTKNIDFSLWNSGIALVESNKPIYFLKKINNLNKFSIDINNDGSF